MIKKLIVLVTLLGMMVFPTVAQDGSQSLTCSSSGREIEGDAGTIVSVTCPADCTDGRVWGTDTYTDDSSVCTAAIHAGALTSEGGTVDVTILPGEEEYPASEQNGIESSSWGSWERGFGFESPLIQLTCFDTTIEGALPGSAYQAVCPANCEAGSIWGTDIYTDDSNICTAAAHTGAIDPVQGGLVDLVFLPGQEEYPASEQNGIESSSWGSWDLSFTFAVPLECDTNALDAGKVGDGFVVSCPAGCDAGAIWGTEAYTTDSSICTAAAHSGVITLEDGGAFALEITAGQEDYPASEQNGIESSSWGSWDQSFVPFALGGVNQLSCDTVGNEIIAETGDSLTVSCPAGCGAGSVWGTDTYTDDSNICTAAAHAGVITLEDGGEFTLTIKDGLSEYPASEQNGISSSSWGSWGRSFTVGQ